MTTARRFGGDDGLCNRLHRDSAARQIAENNYYYTRRKQVAITERTSLAMPAADLNTLTKHNDLG